MIRCPHCDVSLTYHSGGKMVCHYCGYTIPAVHTCPSCGSPYIGGLRAGTEKVADEVSRLFPSARILRMDADTTKRKDMHGKILRSFAAQEADILVGTQMIIKGHDFPAVTLVGILAADMSLFASDYRAPEKTFQLLVQAIGRAGRGKLPGEAIIQTYHPDHYCLKAAAVQDYDRFYKEEIFSRQMMGYPPACHMLAVHGACRSEEKLCMAMAYVRKYLQSVAGKESTVLIGPAPERISRVQDMYRYVLYMKEPDRQEIIRARELLEQYIRINSGFRETYMQYDLDV